MKNSKSQTRKRSRGEIQSQSQKGTKKIRLF